MNNYPNNIVLHVMGYTIPAHAAGLGKYSLRLPQQRKIPKRHDLPQRRGRLDS